MIPDATELAQAGRELREVAAAEHPWPEARFSGRGIVICAGGARLLTCAWVAVGILRRVLGCTLPIELWHIGPGELGAHEAALFGELGVDTVDAGEVAREHPVATLGGWELKPYAILNSRFREVLLLDADNVAVQDPAVLFEAPEYAETGALFWPDAERLRPDSPLWELCGVPYRNEPAWETGQLVVDKARTWPALQVTQAMNQRSELLYPFTHGDKETFHLAWLMTGTPCALAPYPARRMQAGLVQRDFAGRMLFQHRTDDKWRLSGENLRSADFRHERECLQLLDELRERWSGRIGNLPPASPADARLERAVAAAGWYRLLRPGEEDRLLELLDGHRIGAGASRHDLQRWHVRHGELTLQGVERATALGPRDGGAFAGAGGIELRPAPESGRDALARAAEAILAGLAAGGRIDPAEAVTAVAALARAGELSDGLERARSRWRGNWAVTQVIERAQARAGVLGASAKLAPPVGFEPLTDLSEPPGDLSEPPGKD